MSSDKEPKAFCFSGYRLDRSHRKLVDSDGVEVPLSSRGLDTLLVLLQSKGQTISKAELMKAVWPSVVVEENNLNQAVSSLRKALGDSKNEIRFIQTVPGRGYRFIDQVEEVYDEPSEPAVTSTLASTSLITSAIKWLRAKNYLIIPLLAMCILLITSITYLNYNRDVRAVNNAAFSSSLLPATMGVIDAEIIPNSIAVMPFTNLNSNDNNELFSIGLHDEVINQLSKIRSLNVISRESVVALANQQQLDGGLDGLLRVESVMTGTLVFVEEQARVSLQMLDPVTGVTLWANSYDVNTRDLTSMISIQSDIAVSVALTLEAEINQYEQEAVEAIPTDSFEAYRYNLAARKAYYTQDFAQAWVLGEQALELDPAYVDALYGFSYVNTVLTATPLPGMNSQEHFRLALQAAEKIIEVAPDLSFGYALRASALGTNKQWVEVAEEVARLKEMGVPLSEMKFYALILLCMGDFDGAIEILEANLLTEPVNLYGRGFLVSAYELAGNREMSRRAFHLGEELNPVWWGDTINIFLSLGRGEELTTVDDIYISSELKYLLYNLDDHELVTQSLETYMAGDDVMAAEAVYYSAIAAHAGDHELAVTIMRGGLEEVWLNMFWLWMPLFDETRQLESFKRLLMDSGMIEYWQQYGWSDVCQPHGDSFSCDWKAYP